MYVGEDMLDESFSCLKISQLEINKIDPNIPYICEICNEELLFTAPDANNEQSDQNLGKPLIDMIQTGNNMRLSSLSFVDSVCPFKSFVSLLDVWIHIAFSISVFMLLKLILWAIVFAIPELTSSRSVDVFCMISCIEVNLVYRCPICREEAQENTIACEECNEWYHYSCLKISQLEINKIDPNFLISVKYATKNCFWAIVFAIPELTSSRSVDVFCMISCILGRICWMKVSISDPFTRTELFVLYELITGVDK
jgi:hypothetical protein